MEGYRSLWCHKHRAVIKDKRVTFYLYEIDQGTQPVLTRHYAGPLTTLLRCQTMFSSITQDVKARHVLHLCFKQIYTMDFDGNYVRSVVNGPA